MSSRQVDRYLDRERILEEETPTIIKTDALSNMNRQNQDLSEELSIVKESLSEVTARFENLREELDSIRSGKGVLTLIMSLAKQQKQMSKALEQFTDRKFDAVLPNKIAEDGLTYSSVRDLVENIR